MMWIIIRLNLSELLQHISECQVALLREETGLYSNVQNRLQFQTLNDFFLIFFFGPKFYAALTLYS
jgi:hypothetical protein